MKETTSTMWIFNLIIIFIFLFTGFIIVSVNYSRAYKSKNEILNILEKYEGYTSSSRIIINNYLTQIGYKDQGSCGNYTHGEENIKESKGVLPKVNKSKKYYYCIERASYKSNSSYYKVKLFFKFNLPIFGELNVFSVTGKTKEIRDYSDAIKLEK